MSLRLVASAAVRGLLTSSADLGTPTFNLDMPITLKEFGPGASAGQVAKLFSDTRTLAASATESLDLSGALVDALGQPTVFTVVKILLVKASPANTNNVLVGGAAANAFVGPFADATDIVSIPPGGCAMFVHPGAGWTVTAATGDLLKIANSAGTTGVTYDIVVAG
jgi:hypothetical protein